MSPESQRIGQVIRENIAMVEQMGYTVLFGANYGSHNYGLEIDNEDYKSDIDTKIIILPTLEDLVHNSAPVSTTVKTSTGQCDIKDIRAFIPTLLKANIQFLEILCARVTVPNSKYKEEVEWLQEHLEELVKECKTPLLKSIYGMSMEKKKAMCHPYPTIAWKIDKWGYDGKQVHHIMRLYEFMKNYFEEGKNFNESIRQHSDIMKHFLLDTKMNKIDLETAKNFANIYCALIKAKVDTMLTDEVETAQWREAYKRKAAEIIINNIKKKILEDEYRANNRYFWQS